MSETNFQSESTRQRPRVLVLETDRLIKALILEWLEMSGYDPIACTLAALPSDGCDVVLVDVSAPLTSAKETVAELLRAVPGIPVIAMSADVAISAQSAADALARELAAAAVLVKPFTREELLIALSRARI